MIGEFIESIKALWALKAFRPIVALDLVLMVLFGLYVLLIGYAFVVGYVQDWKEKRNQRG